MSGNGFGPGKRVQRSIQVLESLDIELKKKAAELKIDKSDLYELGARLVLAVLELGYLPDNCAELARVDEAALGELASLARLARSLAEEPSYEVV